MGKGFSIKARGREADILIYEDVGESFFGGVTARQFAENLASIGAVDVLNVRISSLGGDVMDGLAIYRRLVEHKARVISHVDGWAASIASVIAMAGDEIRIAEGGAIMIHEAFGRAVGTAADFRMVADRLDANTSAIADVYQARTGNTVEQLRQWMAAETWFYGQEAVDAKFADSLAPNMKVAARFDPSVHRFRHVPKALSAPVAAPAATSAPDRPNLLFARDSVERMQARITLQRLS